MNIVSDEEYLDRPLLDVEFKYNQDYINVSSEHTSYIRFEKMKKLSQSEILETYSNVIKLCRQMGIKISYTRKMKKFVTENWQTYLDKYKEYDNKFKEVVSMIPQLEDRGIHQGSSDDFYLEKVTRKSWELNPYYYRDSILFQMRSIYHELGTLEHSLIFEQSLKNPEKHMMGKTVKINL